MLKHKLAAFLLLIYIALSAFIEKGEGGNRVMPADIYIVVVGALFLIGSLFQVLFVSYVFPPVSSPGAVRVERMAHYLSDQFEKVGVLTCENPYSSMVSEKVASEKKGYLIHYIKDLINKSAYADSSRAERKKTIKGRLAQRAAWLFFPDKNISWFFSVVFSKKSSMTMMLL